MLDTAAATVPGAGGRWMSGAGRARSAPTSPGAACPSSGGSSFGMLAVARSTGRPSVVQGDMRRLPVDDGSCSLVVAFYSIHRFRGRRRGAPWARWPGCCAPVVSCWWSRTSVTGTCASRSSSDTASRRWPAPCTRARSSPLSLPAPGSPCSGPRSGAPRPRAPLATHLRAGPPTGLTAGVPGPQPGTVWAGACPASTSHMASQAMRAMRVRVRLVALPMWGSRTVRGAVEEAGVDRRLPFVDVEPGGEEVAGVEGVGQRRLVDHRAAGRVDQHGGGLHGRPARPRR